MDHYGGDIMYVRSNSSLDCNEQCKAVPQCRRWTFTPDDGNFKKCFLKRDTDTEHRLVVRTYCISGFKQASSFNCGTNGNYLILA